MRKSTLLLNGLLTLIFCIIISSCSNKSANQLKIQLSNAHPNAVYLYQTSESDNFPILIDSIKNDALDKLILFKIPAPDFKLYQLTVSPYLPSIFFINDTKGIEININLNDYKNYEIKNSKGSEELQRLHSKLFTEQQKLSNPNLLSEQRIQIQSEIQNEYLNLAMKAQNPLIALFAADNYNFENKTNELTNLGKSLILRFPENASVKNYVNKSVKIINTLQREYQPGDTLPLITVYDKVSKTEMNIPLTSKKWHIYEFFSVIKRTREELNLIRSFQQTNKEIAIYSFPAEPDSTLIYEYIKSNNVNWPHFTDYQGWHGNIIPKFYIDSVPYLFVTDQKGIILYKNIPLNIIQNVKEFQK